MAYGFQSIKDSRTFLVVQLSPFPAPSQPQPRTPESQDPYPAPATVPGSLQPQASPVPGGPGSHPRVPSTQPCPAPESRAELTFFRLFFDFLLPPVIRQG